MTALEFGLTIMGVAGLLWLLSWVFKDEKPRQSLAESRIPIPGETWQFNTNKKGDPFPSKCFPPVKILETSDGFVYFYKPIPDLQVTPHLVDVADIERERILDAMGIAPQHREKPSELSGIRVTAAMQPSAYEAFLSQNSLEEESDQERDRR